MEFKWLLRERHGSLTVRIGYLYIDFIKINDDGSLISSGFDG